MEISTSMSPQPRRAASTVRPRDSSVGRTAATPAPGAKRTPATGTPASVQRGPQPASSSATTPALAPLGPAHGGSTRGQKPITTSSTPQPRGGRAGRRALQKPVASASTSGAPGRGGGNDVLSTAFTPSERERIELAESTVQLAGAVPPSNADVARDNVEALRGAAQSIADAMAAFGKKAQPAEPGKATALASQRYFAEYGASEGGHHRPNLRRFGEPSGENDGSGAAYAIDVDDDVDVDTRIHHELVRRRAEKHKEIAMRRARAAGGGQASLAAMDEEFKSNYAIVREMVKDEDKLHAWRHRSDYERPIDEVIDRIKRQVEHLRGARKAAAAAGAEEAEDRRSVILAAYERAQLMLERARNDPAAETIGDTELTQRQLLRLQDEQRRLECARAISTADNPSQLKAHMTELCDQLADMEARAAVGFYRGEKLASRLTMEHDRHRDLDRAMAEGAVGDVADMKAQVDFFREERDFLYDKMLLMHTLHIEKTGGGRGVSTSTTAVGADTSMGTGMSTGTDAAPPELQGTDRLRKRVFDMQQTIARWKLREKKLINRLARAEAEVLAREDQLAAAQHEIATMRRKYIEKMQEDTDKRAQVARQAAELQMQINTRKNYFFTKSHPFRSTVEYLKNDRRNFLQNAIRYSGANKQSEDVRTIFNKFIEETHKAVTQTLSDMTTTVVDDMSYFMDDTLAERWTRRDDAAVATLIQRLGIPGPHSLFSAGAEMLKSNWELVLKALAVSSRGLFEVIGQLSKDLDSARTQEQALRREINNLYQRVTDLSRSARGLSVDTLDDGGMLLGTGSTDVSPTASAHAESPRARQGGRRGGNDTSPADPPLNFGAVQISAEDDESALRAKLQTLNDRQQGFQARIRKMRDNELSQTALVQSLQGQVKNLQGQQSATEDRSDVLEERLTAKNERVDELETQLHEVEGAFREAAAKLKETLSERDAERARLGDDPTAQDGDDLLFGQDGQTVEDGVAADDPRRKLPGFRGRLASKQQRRRSSVAILEPETTSGRDTPRSNHSGGADSQVLTSEGEDDDDEDAAAEASPTSPKTRGKAKSGGKGRAPKKTTSTVSKKPSTTKARSSTTVSAVASKGGSKTSAAASKAKPAASPKRPPAAPQDSSDSDSDPDGTRFLSDGATPASPTTATEARAPLPPPAVEPARKPAEEPEAAPPAQEEEPAASSTSPKKKSRRKAATIACQTAPVQVLAAGVKYVPASDVEFSPTTTTQPTVDVNYPAPAAAAAPATSTPRRAMADAATSANQQQQPPVETTSVATSPKKSAPIVDEAVGGSVSLGPGIPPTMVDDGSTTTTTTTATNDSDELPTSMQQPLFAREPAAPEATTSPEPPSVTVVAPQPPVAAPRSRPLPSPDEREALMARVASEHPWAVSAMEAVLDLESWLRDSATFDHEAFVARLGTVATSLIELDVGRRKAAAQRSSDNDQPQEDKSPVVAATPLRRSTQQQLETLIADAVTELGSIMRSAAEEQHAQLVLFAMRMLGDVFNTPLARAQTTAGTTSDEEQQTAPSSSLVPSKDVWMMLWELADALSAAHSGERSDMMAIAQRMIHGLMERLNRDGDAVTDEPTPLTRRDNAQQTDVQVWMFDAAVQIEASQSTAAVQTTDDLQPFAATLVATPKRANTPSALDTRTPPRTPMAADDRPPMHPGSRGRLTPLGDTPPGAGSGSAADDGGVHSPSVAAASPIIPRLFDDTQSLFGASMASGLTVADEDDAVLQQQLQGSLEQLERHALDVGLELLVIQLHLYVASMIRELRGMATLGQFDDGLVTPDEETRVALRRCDGSRFAASTADRDLIVALAAKCVVFDSAMCRKLEMEARQRVHRREAVAGALRERVSPPPFGERMMVGGARAPRDDEAGRVLVSRSDLRRLQSEQHQRTIEEAARRPKQSEVMASRLHGGKPTQGSRLPKLDGDSSTTGAAMAGRPPPAARANSSSSVLPMMSTSSQQPPPSTTVQRPAFERRTAAVDASPVQGSPLQFRSKR